uniref:C2H2-type domain-containing protein n=1 Tax=Triticum aestivum TaxID=4565 RepID=A0A077S1G7_WHEAT|nr:unnamed protein product [Triticum aestivum]
MSKRGRGVWDMELGSLDTTRLLMLLAQQHQHQHHHRGVAEAAQAMTGGRVFQCKTCNRQFPHAPPQPARPRVHECPICGLEFAVGQALGGHMRRHRVEAEAEAGANAPSSKAAAATEMVVASCDDAGICLDLNLTPSENCAKCKSAAVLRAATGQGVHKALGGHMSRYCAEGETEAHATSAKDSCDMFGRRQRYLPLSLDLCGRLEDTDISVSIC